MIKNPNKCFKKKRLILLLIVLCTIFQSKATIPWGFYAHKKINHLAIYTLPAPLVNFYKRHTKEIEEMAVLPDQRRYMMDEEAARHYIDLDHYDIIRVKNTTWEEVLRVKHLDSLLAHGIVVWHIPILYRQLKSAFERKDTLRIIKLSAEMGHYIADAHVPLHTTSNYDGQKTGQTGLHSFWESRIPELLKEALEEWVGPAIYIPNLQMASWQWIVDSHQEVAILLQKESNLRKKFNPTALYTFEQKGSSLQKIQSKKFSLQYHQILENQIENRFNLAIKHIGDVWFSAWIDAGQPIFK